MSNHLGGVADVYDSMGDRVKPTTPTYEEVRRQFEAWFGGAECSVSDIYRAEALEAYQAALTSPAVVALVEALGRALKWTELLPPGEPLRDECVADLDFALAALAPFTTGAGHVE